MERIKKNTWHEYLMMMGDGRWVMGDVRMASGRLTFHLASLSRFMATASLFRHRPRSNSSSSFLRPTTVHLSHNSLSNPHPLASQIPLLCFISFLSSHGHVPFSTTVISSHRPFYKLLIIVFWAQRNQVRLVGT